MGIWAISDLVHQMLIQDFCAYMCISPLLDVTWELNRYGVLVKVSAAVIET